MAWALRGVLDVGRGLLANFLAVNPERSPSLLILTTTAITMSPLWAWTFGPGGIISPGGSQSLVVGCKAIKVFLAEKLMAAFIYLRSIVEGDAAHGEWPKNKSLTARIRFEKKSAKLFKTGDGEKAKRVFAVQELQDLIFSSSSVEDLYQFSRVCKQWKAATVDNSHTEMQVALFKKQSLRDRITPSDAAWKYNVHTLSLLQKANEDAVFIPSNHFDFFILFGSLGGTQRSSGGPGTPKLSVKVIRKHEFPGTSDVNENSSVGPTNDSRLDMTMFPEPFRGELTIDIKYFSPTTLWNFSIGVTDDIETKMPHWYTVENVPLNGTLREMVKFLEQYFLAQVDRYSRLRKSFEE